MRILTGIFVFYIKLIIPTLAISVALETLRWSITDHFSIGSVGSMYIFFALLFHFYTYEINRPNEYVFYHNMGLSKIALWVSTIIISVLIGLLMILYE
ncbi:MAG: hypothetical protein Q7J34_05145 [Bacteroidales bacterium]|nr:hypothetical protein [Bacteroidales bacterium]